MSGLVGSLLHWLMRMLTILGMRYWPWPSTCTPMRCPRSHWSLPLVVFNSSYEFWWSIIIRYICMILEHPWPFS